MLLQAAANYTVETFVLENDENCPAAHLCHHFVNGDIRNYNDVYSFGKQVDAITIEIESVNIDALEQLSNEGVRVIPHPSALRIIQNKITQKQFYQAHEIPSPPFKITQNSTDILQHLAFLPAVHKIGVGGYDGKGVQLIETEANISEAFQAPSVLEKKVAIAKEISVIVAKSENGEMAIYPIAEMITDPILNLLDYQLSPAKISEKVLWKAEAIALKLVKELASPGLFAIEMFIDQNEQVWVNETAPRVHNSGHHTIEANFCSQYDMLWRILLQYPLGNTAAIMPSAIVNIIGSENHSGLAFYENLHEVQKIPNAFIHLYGKLQTKPGRKMGHVTIMSTDYQDLTHKAHKIKNLLKVVTQ
jgi:5-(carboxyamino)imidazole ribonucleotide synthase